MIERPSTALARVLDALTRSHRTAIAHDRHQQLAILKFGHVGHQGGIIHGHEGIAARGALPRQMVLVVDHVADRAAKAVVITAHALHTRDRALVGLLGELDHRRPWICLARTAGGKLVHAAQRRLVIAGRELGTHAKAVDGRALVEQRLNRVLIQIVRNRDPHIGQALGIKTAADILGQLGEVTRVNANGRQALARRLHLLGNRNGMLAALAHVVGIDEQRAVLGARLGKGAEGLEFGVKAHHPAVRVRAKDGDAVTAPGKHVRRGRTAGNVARARDGQAAIGALGTAQAKLRHGTAVRRQHHARRLGGDKCLEADDVQQRRLEQLALQRGAGDAHHGLARKHELALGHGVNVHVRTEVAQVVEECRLKHRAAGRSLERGEVVDVLGRKAQVLDKLGQLGGAAHDGIRAAKGMVTVKRRKTTLLIGLAALPQALGHSEFVQIGEHCDVGGMRDVGQSHGATFRMCGAEFEGWTRAEHADMTPDANRLEQAHAGQDRVAHKDDKRDEGKDNDDFLSRRHARDLVLAHRLLGGNHALGKGHLVTARLGLDGLGTGGLFRLRFGRGRCRLRSSGLGCGRGRRCGCGVRGDLLGLRTLGTQDSQLLTLATGLFTSLAAGLLGAELFQLGALLVGQWLGLKLGHGTALSFKKSRRHNVSGLSNPRVETKGVEPSASAMRRQRSPN